MTRYVNPFWAFNVLKVQPIVKLADFVNKLFLMQEKEACQALRMELEDERRRALRMEARVEEQLAEFDTEREQLRSRLKKEEALCCQLQQQVWSLDQSCSG